MRQKRASNGFFIKLEKGEEIIEQLTKFCKKNYIKSGLISGIGGTDNVSIKYYDLDKKEYLSKNFSGKNYEITSLSGNISEVDGNPYLHVHITISDSDCQTFGGHLGAGVISVTGEIMISITDDVIHRKFDDEFKLNFWDL